MPELPLVGDEFAGYRLRSVLGRGGMSVVYMAENPNLGSLLALKVLAPELAADDAFRARFLAESRTAASLNHPNVIPIYDTGSSAGLLYIAMRYVAGTDMRQMIKKRGRLVPETALFLLGQAARALDVAHRRGLVHRDVKPGNLLVERGSEDDEDPDHVYLTDFGITKHAMSRSGLTATGQFVGTIDYVAPEQIRGVPVTGMADQYSLGCVLYECLTGRVPFEKDLDAAIIFAHVQERPTAPTALRPDLPPGIDEVFARVLAKQPGDRYGNCREFIDAARVALGGRPSTGSQTFALPDTQTAVVQTGGRPPDPALEPLPGPAVRAATGLPPEVAHSGDTIVSHRRYAGEAPPPVTPREPGGRRPPRGPSRPRAGRWYRRPRWIAALSALVLVGAGAGTWALVSGGSGSHPLAMPTMSMPKPKPTPTSALMNALKLTNESPQAKGQIPPSTCKQQSVTMVTCTNPSPTLGISQATFQTYPSLTALYAAYEAQVKSLNANSYTQNFNDCNDSHVYGEVGWNHLDQHPMTYTVQQMIAGMVTQVQAAGRMFCNYLSGQEYIIWTQDAGNLLAAAFGPVHGDVFDWWVDIHHNIGFAGMPAMNM
jgi:serine/threonine protein kinase